MARGGLDRRSSSGLDWRRRRSFLGGRFQVWDDSFGLYGSEGGFGAGGDLVVGAGSQPEGAPAGGLQSGAKLLDPAGPRPGAGGAEPGGGGLDHTAAAAAADQCGLSLSVGLGLNTQLLLQGILGHGDHIGVIEEAVVFPVVVKVLSDAPGRPSVLGRLLSCSGSLARLRLRPSRRRHLASGLLREALTELPAEPLSGAVEQRLQLRLHAVRPGGALAVLRLAGRRRPTLMLCLLLLRLSVLLHVLVKLTGQFQQVLHAAVPARSSTRLLKTELKLESVNEMNV